MERNFFRRVEIAFPVREQTHRERILRDLNSYLADNTQAWALGRDGGYSRCVARTATHHDAQSALLARLCGRQRAGDRALGETRYFGAALSTHAAESRRLEMLDLALQVRHGQRVIVQPARPGSGFPASPRARSA